MRTGPARELREADIDGIDPVPFQIADGFLKRISVPGDVRVGLWCRLGKCFLITGAS